jgi:hypothetical protein
MLEEIFKPRFYNINTFMPDLWSTYSVTVVLGLCLITVIMIVWFVVSEKFWTEQRIAILLTIVLAPFLYFFVYQHLRLINNDLSLMYDNSAEKARKQLCRMDDTQQIGGMFCNVPIIVANLPELVPVNSKIIFYSVASFPPYLHYLAYDQYYLVRELRQADYAIFYLYQGEVWLDQSGQLNIANASGLVTEPGVWQKLIELDGKYLIFKRL